MTRHPTTTVDPHHRRQAFGFVFPLRNVQRNENILASEIFVSLSPRACTRSSKGNLLDLESLSNVRMGHLACTSGALAVPRELHAMASPGPVLEISDRQPAARHTEFP